MCGGVNMINIDANKGKEKNKYTDKYFWYPKGNSNTHKENEDTYKGKFYACDVINFNNSEQQMNGISTIGFEHLTIETRKRFDFKQGDRIKSVIDNRFWNIDNVVVDDDAKAKELSARPPKITILTLSRTEVENV